MALKRSVAQQNNETLNDIREVAGRFASKPESLRWLVGVLEKKQGLDVEAGILARLASVPDQDCEDFHGLWLTRSKQFWAFEVSIPYEAGVARVERFEQVTASTVVCGHLRGTGKSHGYLALQVLDEHREFETRRPRAAP